MAALKNTLPSKIFDVIDRAGISTVRQVITLSVYDIKKHTNLSTEDIMLLKNVASDYLLPSSITCNNLILQPNINTRVSTGCTAIDAILMGGLRKGTLTELYGESGSGKTQIALQAAAHNWNEGTIYFCTEDLFPTKRFQQMKCGLLNYDPNTDYGKNIFVEHVTEAHELLSCIRVRLPKLLEKNKLNLIILDSIAAPFRSEYTNYVQRAEDLRELAISLINIAQNHNLAVLCINQVTASFTQADIVLPALGLAWSNMISTRLWLSKTSQTVLTSNHDMVVYSDPQKSQVRELHIMFSSDLPNSVAKLIITPTGVQDF